MKEPIVSIVAPVYNVERFLAKCIDSILSQTFDKWELLLIDDGSTDKSGEICDYYLKKDSRIQVIHTQNQGRSAARNTGISKAKGEWLVFVDSDDSVNELYLQAMLNVDLGGEKDVIVSQGYKPVDDDGLLCSSYAEVKYEEWTIIPPANNDIIENNELLHIQAVWGRLFNMGIIRNNNIFFDQAISHSEDGVFLHQYLLHCKKCYFISFQGYNYRVPIVNNSIFKVDYEETYQLASCYQTISKGLIEHFNITNRQYKQRIIDLYISRLGKLLFDENCPNHIQLKAKELSRKLVIKRPLRSLYDFKLLLRFMSV